MSIRISDFMIFVAILSFVTIDISAISLLQKAILRVLLVGFSVALWLKHPIQNFELNKIRFQYILLIGFILISTLWSRNPSINILRAIDPIIYVIFISSYFRRFSYYSDWEFQLSLVNGVTYFLAVFSVLAVLHSSQFVHFDRTGFFRLGGHGINSNFLSVLCVVPVGFYLFSERKFSCTRFLFYFFGPLVLLVLSGSRAPTLLFLISIFLLILRSYSLKSLLVSLLILFTVTIVSFEFLLLQFRLTSISDVMTLTGRTEIWRDLLANAYGASLLFGYGAFDVSSKVDGELVVLNGHNSFINALLYAGAGALVLHLSLTFSIIRFWARIYFLSSSEPIINNLKFLFIFLTVILGMHLVEGALVGRNSVLMFLSVWAIWFISRKQYENN